ncbi:hypothetical protein [Marinobacter halophilus]|nr:hypothetical protein [Marinobacter halophilus]
MPWLVLGAFAAGAAMESSLLLLAFLPPICLLGWRSFQKHGLLQGPNAVIALRFDHPGVTCQFRDGSELHCRISTSSSLGAAFLVLRLQPEDTRSNGIVVLITGNSGPFRANVPEADFRRLRMWLRIGQPSGTS